MACLDYMGVDKTLLISITADGAPSLTGRHIGFCKLFDDYMKQHFPDHKRRVLFFHCLIHQEALAKNVIELNNVTSVVTNLVNFLRSSKLRHRQFQEFAESFELGVKDVKYHCAVRWLSMAEVLNRIYTLLPVINQFLSEQKNTEFPELEQDDWLNDFAFAVDLFLHLNTLNLQLQGKNQFVHTSLGYINTFMAKLKSTFQEDIIKQEFEYFPKLGERIEELKAGHIDRYIEILNCLHINFQSRFQDFRQIKKLIYAVANPFTCDISDLPEMLAQQIIQVRNDNVAKQAYAKGDILAFYTGLEHPKYNALKAAAYMMLSIFGSTYLCESTFSTMKLNKSGARSQLTNKHLRDILVISTTNLDVDHDALTEQNQTKRKKYA